MEQDLQQERALVKGDLETLMKLREDGKLVLERYKKGFNNTSLMDACRGPNPPEIIRKLLEWGADVNAFESSGRNVLHCCALWCRYEHMKETVQILIDAGCHINVTSMTGVTPLDEFLFCAQRINWKSRSNPLFMSNVLEAVRTLLMHGARVYEMNDAVIMRIYEYCNRQPELIDLIMKRGKDFKGNTALHFEYWLENEGNVEKMKNLIDGGGCDLNATNGRGRTPLASVLNFIYTNYSSIHINVDILHTFVLLLLRNGASVMMVNEGWLKLVYKRCQSCYYDFPREWYHSIRKYHVFGMLRLAKGNEKLRRLSAEIVGKIVKYL